MCHSAQWGLVCAHLDSYFTPAAEVVCRQVGIPSRSQFVCGFQHERNIAGICGDMWVIMYIYYTDPRALRRDITFYSDSPVVLNDIRCSGSEAQLTQCTTNGYGNFSSNCIDIAVALCEGESHFFPLCITIQSCETEFASLNRAHFYHTHSS